MSKINSNNSDGGNILWESPIGKGIKAADGLSSKRSGELFSSINIT
ncbi:MAG: hypothetical protein HYV28_11170 [Ignavibacteriales bacterium]|nr:hypothetical protein [Ignavibacteriales bacterium]